MSDQNLRLVAPAPLIPSYARPVDHRPLGRYLVEAGVITAAQLVQALKMQLRLVAPLGEILIAEGWAETDDIMAALSRQHGLARADLTQQLPDPRLARIRPATFWLKHRVIPWMRLGGTVLVATARPDLFRQVRAELAHDCPELLPVLAPEAVITAAIARQFAGPLAEAAQTRVAARFSCRTWLPPKPALLAALALALLALALLVPSWLLGALFVAAILTLSLFFALKLTGFVAQLLSHNHLHAPRAPPKVDVAHGRLPGAGGRLPKVSVLVPLFRETEIAGALIRRLMKLSYPKVLLDVVLVLEEHDTLTREALENTDLPTWIRVIEVPAHGGLTTKPRAMNYALDFCQGEIIGVWDAEDAPAPDQIEQVVARFAQAPDDVVCLQGILDYYNPRSNWLARCFTIEYASWFRIILPGIARIGLVVPLGGTTLFFRRHALEELGGWDAHNVTEDADLGVRLCRAGWRTELIDTVTFEEANCRAWPWIRQRSRWLKGFMVTYLVHMRDPRRLWSDLGAWRFFGFQAFFLGTLGQFLLAPVLWSFWLMPLGFDHPAATLFAPAMILGGAILLALGKVLELCIGLAAVSTARRRHLLVFVPTMMFYFPLGVIAAYKGLGELLFRPYYWDKTQHGHAVEECAVD